MSDPQPDRRVTRSRSQYVAALDRLKDGSPRHPKLQAALASGKGYSITPTSVALEAGKSRDPLYKRYSDILAMIAKAAGGSGRGEKPTKSATVGRAKDEFKKLRHELKALKSDNAKLATENLAMLVRLAHMAEEIERLKRDQARADKRSNQVIGLRDMRSITNDTA